MAVSLLLYQGLRILLKGEIRMAKILFVSEYLCGSACGAKALSLAHLQIIEELYGYSNIKVLAVTNGSSTFEHSNSTTINSGAHSLSMLKNCLAGHARYVSTAVVSYIKENALIVDAIFFDNDSYGELARLAKKINPNIKILCFAHGIKGVSSWDCLRQNPTRVFRLPHYLSVNKNERLMAEWADSFFVLNDRDASNFEKVTAHATNLRLPVFFYDSADAAELKNSRHRKAGDCVRILFVGGTHWPNIEGAEWFADNVMPSLGNVAHFYIVGLGMEIMRDRLACHKNVTVVGGVDDLSIWYQNSDVVVGPIFSGEGMKTKTAEAFMYGKLFLGSDEAFCGYRYPSDWLCNTAQDYIDWITKLSLSDSDAYCETSRELYEKYYSDSSVKKTITEAMDSLGLNKSE